jgi:hypothetical protein
MDDRDPARRIRALDDELAQRAAWTWALSRQANHHGEVSAEGYEEAKREVGITEPPPNTEPPEPEQTPGDGGARTDHQPGHRVRRSTACGLRSLKPRRPAMRPAHRS